MVSEEKIAKVLAKLLKAEGKKGEGEEGGKGGAGETQIAQRIIETKEIEQGGLKEVDTAAEAEARRVIAETTGIGEGSSLGKATAGGVKGLANLIGDITEEILGKRGGESKVHCKTMPKPAVWMPPAVYWQTWQKQLKTRLLKVLDQLKPQDKMKQLGGVLDVNQALTWSRGNMRIWKKHTPDLTLDMGAHVIFACDGTGSMDGLTMQLSGSKAPIDTKIFYPAGLANASDKDEWIKTHAKKWIISKDVTYSPYGISSSFDNSYIQAYQQLILPQNNKMTAAGATAGVCWVISQTMEDIGSDVEIMWWAGYSDFPADRPGHWVGTVKPREQKQNGFMYCPLVADGGHENWEAPWIAIDRFKEANRPGRVFITISDGQFGAHDKPKYIEGVDALNKMGVATVLIWIGGMMTQQLTDARDSGSVKTIKDLSMHHKYVFGGDDPGLILSKVPALLAELQTELARNALKRVGIHAQF